jgi:putative restriction endonuclease
MGPQGIFKPAVLADMPLSITSVPVVEGQERPYDDMLGADGLLRYRYRGTDPNHPDNAGLRRALMRRAPLIYFHGIVPGLYQAEWPVFIVGDDPSRFTFTVSVDERQMASLEAPPAEDAETAGRRKYVTQLVQRRAHQALFRYRVLEAYHRHCAVCRLRHEELLEAAHTLPDGHPRGEPVVCNGLALCKLHHAAFDANILGVTPDYAIELRLDILEEHDGPMLVHGLQGFHGKQILVPRPLRLKPRREFLEERYALFLKAC